MTVPGLTLNHRSIGSERLVRGIYRGRTPRKQYQSWRNEWKPILRSMSECENNERHRNQVEHDILNIEKVWITVVTGYQVGQTRNTITRRLLQRTISYPC